MSRMQNILDKAERDGAVLRIRPLADQDPIEMPKLGEPVTTMSATVHAPIRTATPARIDRALVAAHSPDAAAARQYRGLCTRIMHADQGGVAKVILITSPGQGDGKTVTAANLALTMSREYHRPTCLVETNLRTPKLRQMFGLPDGPGLIDVIAGRATLDQALTIVEPTGVTVLPAGEGAEHPAELLSAPLMRRTIDSLRAQFDRIVIDAPAAMPMVDLGLLQPLADRVILIVRSGVTSKAAIHDVLSTIDSSRLLGVVLNEAL